jgi:hypothetical protein
MIWHDDETVEIILASVPVLNGFHYDLCNVRQR